MMAFSTTSICITSCSLAPVTTSVYGTPWPSTSRRRLLPFSPRSVGLRPTDSSARCALSLAPSRLCHRQASPSTRSYSASPAFQMDSNTQAALPFQEALIHRAGAAEALFGQRLPLAARTQHKHNRPKHLACRLARTPSVGLANVHFGRRSRANWKQRIYPPPEVVCHRPRFDTITCRRAPAPTPHSIRLGAAVHYLRISS